MARARAALLLLRSDDGSAPAQLRTCGLAALQPLHVHTPIPLLGPPQAHFPLAMIGPHDSWSFEAVAAVAHDYNLLVIMGG